MPQMTLAHEPPPPPGWTLAAVDPGKDTLHTALLRRGAATTLREALRSVEFRRISWCTLGGWQDAIDLFTGLHYPVGDERVRYTRDGSLVARACGGYVLCEAQWAGSDARDKWSGLSALCQTSGALRAACVAAGYGMASVTHWTRNARGDRVETPLTQRRDGAPWVYGQRGLGFIEPDPWRTISLAPRPISPRATVRRVEQRCAQDFLGRAVGADFSAAFGMLLASLGINYTDLGVAV